MNDIEKRARELLADIAGLPLRASDSDVIALIVAALTPPEGYVLVEEKIFDSMREFVTGFHGMSRNNAENLAAEIVDELNAARPEVPNGSG